MFKNPNKKAYLLTLFSSLLNGFFPILIIPHLTNLTKTQEFGELYYYLTVSYYVSTFCLLGIPIYGVRELAKIKTNMSAVKLIKELTTISLIVFVIFVVGLLFFSNLSENKLFLSLSIIISFFQLFSFDWALQAKKKFIELAIRNIAVKLIGIFLMFSFLESPTASKTFLIIMIFVFFSNSAINYIILNKDLKINVPVSFSFKKYTLNKKPFIILILVSAAISIYTILDIIILKHLSSFKEVAIYTPSIKLVRSTSLIMSFFLTISYPILSNLKENFSEYKKAIEIPLNLILITSLNASFILYFFGGDLIDLFLDQSYSESKKSLKILSPLPFIVAVSTFFGTQVLTVFDRELTFLKTILMFAILSVILNFALVPLYYNIGAAISTVLTELFIMIALIYFSFKFFQIFDVVLLTLKKFSLYIILVFGLIVISELFLINNEESKKYILLIFMILLLFNVKPLFETLKKINKHKSMI